MLSRPKRKRFNDFVRTQSVKFTMFSPKEIRALAVTDITHDKIYNKHLPNAGGMNDPRMGTMDRRISCTTCINDNKDCPGHPGKIELPVPMYSVGFIQNTYALLKTICPFCFRINIDESDFKAATILETCEDERIRDDQLFIGLTKIAKDKNKCFRCEMPLPKYSIKGAVIDWEWESEGAILLANLGVWSSYGRPFNAADALSILENVPDEDYELIGLSPKESHPAWAILTVALIPPPPVRPAIMVSEGSKTKGQDDLTSIYQVVIKTCMEIDGIISKMKQDKVKCVPKYDIPKPAKKKKLELKELDETVDRMSNFFDYGDHTKKVKTDRKTLAPSLKDMEDNWFNSFAQYELFDKKDGYCEMDGDLVAVLWENHPKVLEKLQRHLAVIVNNDGKIVPQVNQRSGNPMKTIRARVDTKHGRVRGHLMGKRVDFSGRTVVSPGPDLDIDELGVPEEISKILTIPERVTSFNKERLMKAVRNGDNVWPGAKRILCSDGRVIYLEFISDREGIDLQEGWIVERHLRNGDPVLFNRQPSLHRMSLMCFKAKIMTDKRPAMNSESAKDEEPKESAFRLNLACTKIFNADFDGDEMNIHVLQSTQANAEAMYLMSIEKHIISPQNNAPVISLVQNSLLAAYLLTQEGVTFDREHMELALQSIRYPLKSIPEPDSNGRWSGRQLFSLVLPPALTVTIPLKDNKVVIEGGQILQGQLCKKSLGTSPGNIIDIIVRDIGKREAVIFLSDSQRILDWYLQRRGFSIGIDDYYISKETEEKVKSILDDTKYVSEVIGKIQEIEHLVHDDDLANLEAKIIKMLGSILDRASLYILDEYSKRDPSQANAMLTMILSGAKGNVVNITSLSVAVGQQIVNGGRLKRDRFGRTLPMWKPDSCDPEVQGFVRENYLNGLSPEGAFAHYMGGREGLVDTAVKTSRSGYLQRQIIKALDGITVAQDLSIRMEGKQIVQFLYGGDGMDPMEIEKVGDVSPLFVNNETIAKWSRTHKKWARMLLACRDTARKQLTSLMVRELPEFVLLPVHVKRFLQNFLRKRSVTDRNGKPCDNDTSFTIMKTISQSLKSLLGHEATSVQRYFLLAYINPSTIEEYSLTEGDLNQLCEQVLEKVQVSTITPGAMVGILAGQSAGEQATQTTLNSVARWERVWVRKNGKIFTVSIGEFIDDIMENNDIIVHRGGAEEVTICDFEVLSTSVDGISDWRRVENVSRHPVQGNRLLRVRTRNDREVHATKAKSFVVIQEGRLVPVDGNHICVGDIVPITDPDWGGNIVEDTIVSIEEVDYPDLAYDFTVEALEGNDDTRTFTLASGLVVFDTFHFAGKGNINVTSGVPRFMEIINMSPNPSTPSMTLALNIPDEHKASPGDWIQKCIGRLVSISLLSIVEDHYPVIDPVTDEEPFTCLPEHEELMLWSTKVYGTENDLVSEHMMPSERVWCFVLRKKIMKQQSLTPFMVATAINQVSSKFVTTIHFSEANMDQWYIRIRMWNVKEPVDEDKLQKDIMKMTNLGGVKGITYAVPMRQPIHHFNEDGSVDEVDEWVIRTQGSYIHGVAGLDFVDWNRSYSNHIPETFATLGIGACRNLIIREIQKVVSFEGSYVDLRHIVVLANALTFRGYPMATSRHGQNRVNTGPLMRASFEETGEMILHAGYHAEEDHLLGLTPSLMLGHMAPIGTGMFGLQRKETGVDSEAERLSSQEHLYSLQSMVPSRKERIDPETGLVYGSHELAQKTAKPFVEESKAAGELDVDPGYVWEKTKKSKGTSGRKVRFVEGTKAPARGAYADIDEKQNLDHLDDVLIVKERDEKDMNPLKSKRNQRMQMYKKYVQEVDTTDIDMSGVEMHQETDDTMRNTMGTKLNVYIPKEGKETDSQDISIGAKERFDLIPGLATTVEEDPFIVASPRLIQ